MEIILEKLTSLKSIGDKFARSCQKIEEINLENLPNLESIGKYFAINCSNLTKIKFVNLTNLKSIGDDFAKGTKIEDLFERIPKGPERVEEIKRVARA
jgi:hypothetical protein